MQIVKGGFTGRIFDLFIPDDPTTVASSDKSFRRKSTLDKPALDDSTYTPPAAVI